MTGANGTEIDGTLRLPAELAGWPSWTLDDVQLGDLELLTSGAFAPLTGFMSAADVAAVTERGTLADGTPWPVPVTLEVPADAVPADAGHLVLQDREGSPLAFVTITERTPLTSGAAPAGPASGAAPAGSVSGAAPAGSVSGAVPAGSASGVVPLVRLAGVVTPLREPEHGPFRSLRRKPAEVRAELAGAPAVLAYATRRPLHRRQIGQLKHHASMLGARLLVLVLSPPPGSSGAIVTRPEVLVRVVLAAGRHLPAGTVVVPVPLPPRLAGAGAGLRASAVVAAAYGATHLLADPADAAALPPGNGPVTVPGAGIALIREAEWAYDPDSEVWRPLARIQPGTEQSELSDAELGALLDAGDPVPAWFTPPDVAAELRRARPPRRERGLAVFFTGLSGSGKSTIARGVAEALSERGDRTVSLLDGDHVRRLLSAGLSFSRADRDLNIARIAFVAAEVARHGGIAICAPIAPYAPARAAARQAVTQTGDFLLVYLATPVEVCEARDRKGLYAKARAGLIKEFTGISDPYEEPRDADLVLDTSTMTRAEAVSAVIELLTTGGWLPRDSQPDQTNGTPPGPANSNDQ